MYLFFDTETTGIPRNYKAPASDFKNWPCLVQIAWLVTDATGNEIASADTIEYRSNDNPARVRTTVVPEPDYQSTLAVLYLIVSDPNGTYLRAARARK